MYCLFLPISCLCGVFTGFYTANKQIITLSIVEIGEQLFSIGFSWTALHFLTGNQTLTACRYVILGSCLGSCLTLGCLIFFLQRKKKPTTSNTPISRRLLRTAVPLALADDLRAGISTAENMLVPKRLAFYPSSLSPLADFGMVCGMVFPVIMFPAAILFSLNELLIPELARCGTAGSKKRIQYLAGRSLRISLLYGTFFCGLIFLLSDFLCMRLYHNPEAAKYMRIFSLLIPMLYCDSVTDAMTKGLGQQKICVRYNIITSVLDLLLLYTLLPKYGLAGYFLSFLISHALNFVLSLRRLLKITHIQLLWYVPLLAISALLVAIGISSFLVTPWLRVLSFSLIFLSILSLLGILRKENFLWFRNLLFPGAQE